MNIVVNKGWIHRELRDFLGIFWNSIKSDDELNWEIKDFDRFGKKTQRRTYRIKNHSIWIKIRGEIKERIREKFLNTKRLKSKLKTKIN